MRASPNKKLGEILINFANLKNEDLQKALEDQSSINMRIGEILLDRDLISQEQLYHALSIQFDIPWYNKVIFESPLKKLRECVSEEFAKEHRIVPIQIDEHTLKIVMFDPLDAYALDNLRFIVNSQIEAVMSTQKEVYTAIERLYSQVEDKEDEEDDNFKSLDIIPKLFMYFIEEAIEQEGTKISIGLQSRAENEFVNKEDDILNVAVMSKNDLWNSQSKTVEKALFEKSIEELFSNMNCDFVTEVATIYFEKHIGSAKISAIVVYPGKLAPRIDVYIVYDEQNMKVKESLKRLSTKLDLVVSKKWSEVSQSKNFLNSVKSWEEMLDGWLAEAGISLDD